MTPHRHFFASYTPFVTPVRLANGQVIYSEGYGSVIFEPEGEGVSIDQEMAKLAENNLMFQAGVQSLVKKIEALKMTISEGR